MNRYSALRSVVQVSYPESVAEKSFVDRGLIGEEDYTLSDVRTIDLIAIEILQGIMATPSISEGGYSIKYDYKAIQARIGFLEKRNGIESSTAAIPKVRALRIR